ncbi:MAG: acetylxylan esterase [Pedosphaera sp.]|nr:acetylxylan esterase [Pedosphaera sp.]
MRHSLFACLFLSLSALITQRIHAESRVLPTGQKPNDARLLPLKDYDGYFPFTPPATKADWEKRAGQVRRQLQVAQGLWPMPTKTPLNAVIHGKIDKGEYTIEKVYFESAPGLFVTGNLYRPKGNSSKTGKAPAVLFAHGHWKDARLSEASEEVVRREIASGAERFEEGGRSMFQSMCVQLARMGCVVWQWDMMSDSDALQLSAQVVHRFAKQRPEMNTTENWGLYSTQAETHLQGVMNLQTLNAVRSLDFVLSLTDVDPERIAMTGASGGGTQTMILSAIDSRVTLSFPAVMVSTAMQGGCTCESSSLLRVNTGNVEFAALFAPKPQGMTTANDWTRGMSTNGFPDLQALYKIAGAPNNVMLHRGEHFPHNYNAVARTAFYTWLNRHFKLGSKELVVERDYERLKRADLTVWDDKHPAPKADDADFERKLLRWLHEDSQKQLAALRATPAKYRETVRGALEVMIGRTLASAGNTQWALKHKHDRGRHFEMDGLVRNTTHNEELPVVYLYPKEWNGRTILWLHEQGKAGLFADGKPKPEIQALLDSGATVCGVDLLHQGEFLTDGKPLTRTGKVKNPREFAGYTFGYNHTVFAQRVHDVLTLVRLTQEHQQQSTAVELVGLGAMGPVAAASRALCGDVIYRAAIDTGGFRFGKLTDFHDVNFLPGGAKYDDVPGLLALSAPEKLWLAGEGDGGVVKAFYQAQNAAANLTTYSGPDADIAAAAARWLITVKK